jgi:hypothetical protein
MVGWVLLALVLVIGLPVALMLMGVALAIWVAVAVASLIWSLATFLFGSPVLGLVLALGIGILVGRALAGRQGP